MTDLTSILDDTIRNISELTDEQLNTMHLMLERAYVHTQIERHLRDTNSVS